MPEAAISAVVRLFVRELGDDAEAIFLFGSYGQPYYQPQLSDVNLLVLVKDSARAIQTVRPAFQDLWMEHKEVLRSAPAVAEPKPLLDYLELQPLLARHLAERGQTLHGHFDIPKPGPIAEGEEGARWADEALWASSALAPDRLDPAAAKLSWKRLHRLARRISDISLPADAKATELYAHAQIEIASRFSRPDETQDSSGENRQPGENVQSVIEEQEGHILILNSLNQESLAQLPQGELEKLRANHPGPLFLTNQSQFLSVLEWERPLFFAVGRFRHAAGVDPLANFATSGRSVLRQAGRETGSLQIFELPAAYLSAPNDGQLHRVVHDYQNQLFNMQLRHELLNRMYGVEAASEGQPLPGRSEPVAVRIRGILRRLNWWTGHYARAMERAPADWRIGGTT